MSIEYILFSYNKYFQKEWKKCLDLLMHNGKKGKFDELEKHGVVWGTRTLVIDPMVRSIPLSPTVIT